MTCCDQGYEAKFWAEPAAAPHTFDASSEAYAVVSSTMGKTETRTQAQGIRGTRSRYTVDNRLTQIAVGGTITMEVTPRMLANFLPRILGANASGTSFTLAETIQAFGWLEAKAGDWFRYNDCVVNRAAFRAQAGGIVTVALDVLAKSEDTSLSADPAATFLYTQADEPYTCDQGVLNLSGIGNLSFESVEIIVDNVVTTQFYNSLTATCLRATDRMVTVNVTTCPDITNLHASGGAGTAGTLTFTNGGVSTVFAFASLKWPQRAPEVGGRGPLSHRLTMMAERTSGAAELAVTNDSTP